MALAVFLLVVVGVVVFLARRPSAEKRLDAKVWQAQESISAREYRIARILLQDVLEARPGDPEVTYLLGLALHGLGEVSEGVKAVEEALRVKPGLQGARTFLVTYYSSRNQFQDALEHAEGSRDPRVSLLTARVLAKLGRLQEASVAYGRAISKEAGGLPVLFEALALSQLLSRRGYSGASAHTDKSHSLILEILSVAKKRIAEKPDDAEALLALARATDAAGLEEPEVIEEAWVAADEANPGDGVCLRGYAGFLIRQGREEDARVLLEQEMEVATDSGAHLSFYEFQVRAGEQAEGLDTLREAVDRWPDDVALHGALVRELARAGEMDEARERIAEALTLHPGHPTLLEVSGDLSARWGDLEGAEAFYLECLDARPGEIRLLKKRIRLYLGELVSSQLSAEKPPETVERTASLLKDLLRLNPWDREALRWSADLARTRGRHDLALNYLGRLLKNHPDDLIGRAMRGALLLGKGDLGEAAAELRRVVDSKNSTLADYLLFVRAAFPFGRYEEVVKACRKGLERWPDNLPLHHSLGQALLFLSQGGRFLEHLEKAPAAVRDTPGIRKLAAWCHVQAGRPDKAVLVFQEVLSEDVGARREYARLLFSIGRGEEAERFLRETVAQNPESAAAHLELADFILSQGNRRDARRLFSRALEIEPKNVGALVRFGEFLVGAPEDEEIESELSGVVAALEKIPPGAPEALYLDGLGRLRAMDAKGAEERLGRYVRLRPDRFEGHFHYSVSLARLGQWGKAAQELRKALAQRPGSVEARFRLAEVLFASGAKSLSEGSMEAAERDLKEVLELDGSHQPSRVLLAKTYISMGLPRLTRAQCDEVLKKDPDSVVANFLKGLSLALEGDPKAALESMDRSLRSDPEYPLPWFFRALARLDIRLADGALADLARAEQLGMKGPKINYVRAHALLMQRKPDRALAEALRATVLFPGDPLPRRLLGEIRFRRGEFEEAARAMLEAYELDIENLSALETAAMLFIRAGKHDEAEAALARAEEPSAGLIRARADLERARGRLDSAKDLYKQVVEEDPRAHLGLAGIALDREDLAGARREYSAAIAGGVKDPLTRFQYGSVLQRLGSTGEARAQYDQVLAKLPDHFPALNNLALLLIGPDGDPQRAAGLARRAFALAPENPDVADTLGWVLHSIGKREEAFPLIEKGVAGRPENPEYRYHLGVALAAAGRAEEARERLAKALKEAPRAPWAEEALKVLKSLR